MAKPIAIYSLLCKFKVSYITVRLNYSHLFLLCEFKVSYITVRLSLAIYILLCKFKVSYNYYCEVKLYSVMEVQGKLHYCKVKLIFLEKTGNDEQTWI